MHTLERIKWAVLAAALAGCASAVPTERLQSSSAAIRAAEEVGVANVPQAALHLQLAKEESTQAQKLIAEGKRDDASFVLMRAEADANLAIALKRSMDEQLSANDAANKVRALQTGPVTP